MSQLVDSNTAQKVLQNDQNIVWEGSLLKIKQKTTGYTQTLDFTTLSAISGSLQKMPRQQSLPTQFNQPEVLSDGIEITNNGGQREG